MTFRGYQSRTHDGCDLHVGKGCHRATVTISGSNGVVVRDTESKYSRLAIQINRAKSRIEAIRSKNRLKIVWCDIFHRWILDLVERRPAALKGIRSAPERIERP